MSRGARAPTESALRVRSEPARPCRAAGGNRAGTGAARRADRSGASTRRGRRVSRPSTGAPGPAAAGPSGTGRPTTGGRASATWSAALDVHADYLRARPRRDGESTLAFMRSRITPPATGARDPRLRRRQQHRTRPDPNLRQLPQPDREPLRRDRRVRLQEPRLPRLGRLRFRDGAHIRHRNSPEARRQRRIEAERRQRRAVRQTTTELKLAA
jgi:hypothetical protein